MLQLRTTHYLPCMSLCFGPLVSVYNLFLSISCKMHWQGYLIRLQRLLLFLFVIYGTKLMLLLSNEDSSFQCYHYLQILNFFLNIYFRKPIHKCRRILSVVDGMTIAGVWDDLYVWRLCYYYHHYYFFVMYSSK